MKKICILPFMHTLILPNGSINLCCNSKVHDSLPTVQDGVDDILNNPLHTKVRKEMLAGEQPDECNKCWTNEELDIRSYRQQQNLTYMKYFPRILIANKDGSSSSGVKFFDVRFNNTCNLKCVMCSSDYSSSWAEDEKNLIPIIEHTSLKEHFMHRHNHYNKESFKWGHDEEIVASIMSNASTIERLHFAGGEPLISKQHNILIKELIRLNIASKLYLSYNTNGEFINEETLSLWSHFKKVKVFYSIDSIKDKNEYIRYPSKWNLHESRLDWLDKETPTNISWRLLSTISALNIAYIPEMADWKLSKKYKNIHNNILDGNLFHACPLEHPKYLASNVLPMDIKEIIKEKLFKFSNTRSYKKIATECINFMYSKDQEILLPELIEYLTGLDKLRGTNFRTAFPILKDLF